MGLPSFEVLNALIKFVSVGVPSSFLGGPCDVFEQIMMTLMRLRLNLDLVSMTWAIDLVYTNLLCHDTSTNGLVYLQ